MGDDFKSWPDSGVPAERGGVKCGASAVIAIGPYAVRRQVAAPSLTDGELCEHCPCADRWCRVYLRWIPGPIADFGQVLAVGVDVAVGFDEFVRHRLLQVVASRAELGQPVDDVRDEVKAVQAVLHPHVESGGDGPFFVVEP